MLAVMMMTGPTLLQRRQMRATQISILQRLTDLMTGYCFEAR